MINILALLVALTVSGVSAYYSIIGLTSIFAAAYYPVIIMGSVLELGKLVTTSWLYRNWRTCPWLLKSYLTVAVIILMFISSMGIFGFLSRAHIEQNLQIGTGSADQIQIVQTKIDNEQSIIDDLNKQISQIDAAVSKLTEKGQATNSLQAADKQRKQRDALILQRTKHNDESAKLKEQRVNLSSNVKKMEAEVGPLKYIAEMIYEGKATDDILEKSVRWVIICIVFVFDPLAVVLLLAANHGFANSTNTRLTNPAQHDILILDSNSTGDNNVTKRTSDKEFNNRNDSNTDRQQDLYKERYDINVSTDDKRGFVGFSRRWANTGANNVSGSI